MRIRPPARITIAYQLLDDGNYHLLWVVTEGTHHISEVLLATSEDAYIIKKSNLNDLSTLGVGDMRLFTETTTHLVLVRQYTVEVVTILLFVRITRLLGSD